MRHAVSHPSVPIIALFCVPYQPNPYNVLLFCKPLGPVNERQFLMLQPRHTLDPLMKPLFGELQTCPA